MRIDLSIAPIAGACKLMFFGIISALILGVGAMAEDKTLVWEFHTPGDYCGWQAEGFHSIAVAHGAIRCETNAASYILSPQLDLDARKYRSFVFTAKSNKSGYCDLFFRHSGEDFANKDSMSVNLIGDGMYHHYTVNIFNKPNWQGEIEQVKFVIRPPAIKMSFKQMGFFASEKEIEDSRDLISNGQFEVVPEENTGYPECWNVEIKNAEVMPDRQDGSFRLTAESKNAQAELSQDLCFNNVSDYELSGTYKTDGFATNDKAVLEIEFRDILDKPIKAKAKIDLAPQGEFASFSQIVKVSDLAASGKLRIKLVSASGKSSLDMKSLAALPVPASNTVEDILPARPFKDTKTGLPVVRCEYKNGTPVLTIDGHLSTTMHVWSWDTKVPALIENCRDNGIHIQFLNISSTPWKASGDFDFSRVDAEFAAALSKDPDAYIICGVALDNQINPGLVAWTDAHPDDLVRMYGGSAEIPDYDGGHSVAPSMASKAWQKMSEDLLRKLIRHIKKGAYASRVIGYMPANGVSYEWQQWASVAWPPVFIDYSECARLAFVEWLEAKYHNISDLNIAWKTTHSSFNEITVPSKDSRCKSDLFTFLDPQLSMSEIDFRRYYSEQVADDILQLARVIKEESEGKSICGAFYGYVMHVLGPYRYQFVGHSALSKALRSPDIDFLISPSDYGDREIGGASSFMTATDSVRLHGKVWVDESDLRTNHSPLEYRFFSLSDSKSGMIRHFANTLVAGCGMQIYDFSCGWITGDKRLMNLAGKLRQIEYKMLDVPRKKFATDNSIAVIVDEQSTDYTELSSCIHFETVYSQLAELHRTGVGFDSYLIDDIAAIPDYKCYLFLNTFKITKEQAERIDMLKRDGKTLIFVFAPGITDGEKLDLDRVSDITGIKMSVLREQAAIKVNIREGRLGLKKQVIYGMGNPYGPLFVPKEGEALGSIEGRSGSGLVMKRFPTWTSVFSVAPNIPACVLSRIAESAGMRIVNPYEGDITFVGDRIVAVHTLDGGGRKLYIGRQYKNIEELVTGKSTPVKGGYADVNLDPRSTSIFLAE